MLAWAAPAAGATVWGIVRLQVVTTDPDGVGSVTFHIDSRDTSHELGEAFPVNSTVELTWFTQDTGEGSHTLHATVSDARGATATAARVFEVHNRTRAESIPPTATKVSPDADVHPPLLEPAFDTYYETPMPLPGPINTAGFEDSPFITADGEEFYFWFTPDLAGWNQAHTDGVTGIWRSRRDGTSWTEPERVYLGFFGDEMLDGAPTVFEDTLWFASARSGGVRELDMWRATFEGGHWVDWTNAGQLLNGTYRIGELHVADEGDTLFFDSDRENETGMKDIWVTGRDGNTWTQPEPVTAVNTSLNEGWPYVSPDGAELWFTRVNGGPQVWVSLLDGGEWQPPIKVLDALAGEATFDPDGNLYFVHHFWDDLNNTAIESDIYVCRRRR